MTLGRAFRALAHTAWRAVTLPARLGATALWRGVHSARDVSRMARDLGSAGRTHAGALIWPGESAAEKHAPDDRAAPRGSGTRAASPLPTVVIVPGVFESWHFMRAIIDVLRAESCTVVTVPGLGRNAAPLDAGARAVEAVLAPLEGDIVLVAHSKGGLIAKLVMLGPLGPRITRLIAIATPWHGSARARFIPGRTLGLFRPGGLDLRRLDADDRVNARITTITPAYDPVVPGAGGLSGARNLSVRAGGHFRVLEDPETLGLVLAEVRAYTDAHG